MNFKEDVRKHFSVLLSKDQEEMFATYYNKLIEFNKHTNLTSITEETDVYYKHFYDSLTILDFIYKEDSSLCDMGSGAGFPSIPLKIIYPNLKIVIIDSSNKRIRFLQELVNELKLSDVTLVHSRIEDYAQLNQNTFDYVTARALGNLRLIVELGIPMLKEKGRFIAMKGSKGLEELEEASNALKILNSKVIIRHNLELPNNYGSRMIFSIEKNKHVSGYPRKYQEILKRPL